MNPPNIMSNNFLERLDRAARLYPNKLAFGSATAELTYLQLQQKSQAVGSRLAEVIAPRQAVAVLMEREVWAVAAILGVTQAAGIAAPLDPTMPADRLLKVFETLQPACILVDATADKAIADLGQSLPCPVVSYFDAEKHPVNETELFDRREGSSLLDPIEIFYTSGSTGVPKGVVHTHRGVIDYCDRTWDYPEVVNDAQVYGNQAPFFYANSINDIYIAINAGGTVWLIPNERFLFPESFVQYINEKKITTLLMTPLNYIYIADAGVLSEVCMPTLRTVYMCGEVVPYDKMKVWLKAAPNADCWNFYGATETPYTVQYLLGERDFGPGEIVPSGHTLRGVKLLLLDDNGEQVAPGETGEIYVTSPWLSTGYYRNRALTEKCYIRDPLDEGWDTVWFRSGDLGRINSHGELLIQGRKDTQIKHRGFRMDVGEVDAALRAVEGWQNGCCLFSEGEDKLYCFWVGPLTQKALQDALQQKLEKYMLPNEYVHLDAMPRTSSGKLDRMTLKKTYFKA